MRIIYKSLFIHIIYIYMLFFVPTTANFACEDTTVRVEQIFAVESDPEKRSYLMKEHPQCQHLFDDVKVFADGEGFCHVCGQIHEVSPRNLPIDVFICGPSCKDLSRLNTARRDKVGCYEEEDMNDSTLSGIIESTSGSTYKLGFRKVLQDYCPSIAIYENVRAANERSKDKNGTIQPSPVEARLLVLLTKVDQSIVNSVCFTLFLQMWDASSAGDD